MTDKKKKNYTNLLMMAMGVVVGAAAGFLLMKYMDNNTKSSDGKKLLNAAVIFISLIVTYYLGIIIHEAGHLVMGLLTGYKFVSFRIGSFILVKQAGRFKVGRFALKGTAGQCLMTHDIVKKDEDIPYFWYNAGGGLFNLLAAGLLCLVYFNTHISYLAMYSMIGMVMYLMLGVLNLLPLKTFGVANDGSNILESYRSPETRRAMLNVLIINSRQVQGELLDTMPEELFAENSVSGSISEDNLEFFRASRDLERNDIASAKARFKALLEKKDLVQIFRYAASGELLFCDIITGEPAEVIDGLYSDELKKYLEKAGKFSIDAHRIMYAYYYIYKHDKENADKEYHLAAKLAEGHNNPGAAKSEMKILERIKDNY